MTQAQLIVLLLKIFLISGFVSLAGWVALYTWLTGGQNWRTPVGQTLVIKSMLVAATFLVVALGAFFPWFGRHPLVTGWIDVVLIGGVTPTMLLRSATWLRLHRAGHLAGESRDSGGEDGPE